MSIQKVSGSDFWIDISEAVLNSIFDDCDEFALDETGGRLLGTYSRRNDGFAVSVTGILPAGPNAQRSPTFFLQDGDYQERLFREIEETCPEVEHLGNWHTHHVNGLPTLSSGDLSLYRKIVNHEKHNTDFFYALLVTRKTPGASQRYEIKHFFFRRGEPERYEISHSNVRLTNTPLLRASRHEMHAQGGNSGPTLPNVERVRDQEFFHDFYSDLRPLLSQKTGRPYWKGAFPLVDGSFTNVVAIEQSDEGAFFYSIAMSCQHPAASDVPVAVRDKRFPSARHGILYLERELNRAIFAGKSRQ